MRSLLLLVVVACHDPTTYDVAGPRDWAAHPAIAQVTATGDIYAVSDAHGGFDRLLALLQRHGLVDTMQHWSGANATLVVTGDMIDKGPDGLDVIQLLQALQASAPAAHGAVIVTLGNHEAEFFADPTNSKADASDGIDHELAHAGIDPVAVASGTDPRGAWLRVQPFGAKVGDWFFAHAGNTKGRTIGALEDSLEVAIDTDDFRASELVGSDSLLESRDWYTSAPTVTTAAAALGVHHFVFGHTPSALGARGAIATAQDGSLFRIDCGMSPDVDDSQGALLRIHGGIADQLAADGSITELWRAP